MSSNFDWEWTGNQKRWTEDERKKMQEAFDYFHQSKEWDMICVIYEVDDCFDIVIRDEEDINCRCLHGEVWEKAYLTPMGWLCKIFYRPVAIKQQDDNLLLHLCLSANAEAISSCAGRLSAQRSAILRQF